MLNNFNDGCVEVVVFGGWVAEFEMCGVPANDRGPLIVKMLEVLCCAFKGRFFELTDRGRMTPKPASPQGRRSFGGVKAIARRAAQYGDDFIPMTRTTG